MPTQKTIPEILDIARVSQYLAFNDVANKVLLRGGALDTRLPVMITCERLFIQWRYDVNPNDPTLRGVANYLFDLLGRYALEAENIIGNVAQAKPVVAGPADQTINGSGTASFTITVTSSLPYVVSWYRNGVLVPGETGLNYSYAATLSDNGDEVNAVAASAAGSTSSRVATLTVNTALIGYVYYGPIDHFDDIDSGVDNVTYSFTFPITDGQPFQITMPAGAANNQYELFKVPASQSIKSTWFNTVLNNGTIPDFVFRQYINIGGSGGWNYYLSRNAMSIDVSSSPNMTLS